MDSRDEGGWFFNKPSDEISILKKAFTYPVRASFVGFSGGDDSLATTHYLMNNVPGLKVLHINTGIGIEATRRFVRSTCADYGWPLLEVRAKEDCGQDYDELVMKFGFPGPSFHRVMYNHLKDRAIAHVVREHKVDSSDKVMFLTGIRRDESLRRMRYSGREIHSRGAQLWVSPLYNRSKADFMNYIKLHGIKRSPVSEVLGMSGECLCGSFAHPGEKQLIKIVCPETFRRIECLERRVKEAGFNWGWEDRPPKVLQEKGFGFKKMMPLCVGCEK
jgi:3'-phosphoadenosine 5'-phosphosulfate sulfotransferase (PAPS reductase)/FAD synthetase